MHRCRTFFPSFLIFLFAAIAAEGQIASSPFSQLGIGTLHNNGTVQNQTMGGIGISNPSGWYINSLNPALLTFNRVTSFQAGVQIEKRTLKSEGLSQSPQNGNLDYLAVAFPLKANRWTTAIGITPYSVVNYNMSTQKPAEGSYQLIDYQESGKGGLNQFYWANGVKINKYLSVGVKASYLFGSIVTKVSSFNSLAYSNGGIYTRDSFSGLNFSGGVSLHMDSLFHSNYRLNVGAVGSLGSDLSAQHVKRLQSVTSRGIIIDSLTIDNRGGTVNLPWNAGFGVSFGNVDHWTVGFDLTYLDFRKFDYRLTDSNTKYINGVPAQSYRFGFGAELTPKPEDFTSYFNRVTYRVGGSYETSYMAQENGHTFNDIGGSFGLSLPVSQVSTIDLGIKIGRRGTASQNALEENYFRMYFGVTFNDRFWFIKRKFE